MNLQKYIWENNLEFYLSKNQKEIYEKIKDFKVNGPIHIGGGIGSGKTFLARRLLTENSVYLPIHYDIDKYLDKNYSIIIIGNIKNFNGDIIIKIKKSIQYCRFLVIISESSSMVLDNQIKSLIRRYYDLEPPNYDELQEFTDYFFKLLKLKLQKLPDSITKFDALINWINNLIIKNNE